jgi:hypothetical protein
MMNVGLRLIPERQFTTDGVRADTLAQMAS